MLLRQRFSKWILAAAIPAVIGIYYAVALPGPSHAQPQSANTATQQDFDDALLVTGLPDFTKLVDRFGP